MNIETKPWYASKGVIGGVVAVLAGISALFGYSVSAADQASLIELLAGLAGTAGGLLAIVGRVTAKQAIG